MNEILLAILMVSLFWVSYYIVNTDYPVGYKIMLNETLTIKDKQIDMWKGDKPHFKFKVVIKKKNTCYSAYQGYMREYLCKV